MPPVVATRAFCTTPALRPTCLSNTHLLSQRCAQLFSSSTRTRGRETSRVRPSLSLRRPHIACQRPEFCSTRSFISFPTPPAQHLTEFRTLPYSRSRLYALIADVDSYEEFLPYCAASRVTKWETVRIQKDGREEEHSLPIEGELTVGFSGYNETFASKLRCIPGELVEAISGGDTDRGEIFTHLITQWTLRTLDGNGGSPRTEVKLMIDFQFANPVYAALSQAVTPKMAGVMIEAFENRAREVLSRG